MGRRTASVMVVAAMVVVGACDDGGPATAELNGKVRLDDGRGIADAVVSLGTADEPRWTTTSETDGSYAITAEPGTSLLRVLPPVGFAVPEDSSAIQVVLASEQETEQDVVVSPNLTVEVTLPEDSIQGGQYVGVEGATVTVRPVGATEIVHQATTDTRGVVAAAVDLGDWEVEVTLPDGYELLSDYDATRTVAVETQGVPYWLDFGARTVP